MNWDSSPRRLRKAFVYGALLLLVASYFTWERSKAPKPPIQKFQGGIAEPDLYSSPVPVSPRPDDEKAPTRAETQKSGGSLIISVVDQNGTGVPRIAVTIQGPINSTITTDKRGMVTLQGPAGYYSFKINSGCNDEVEIVSPASGRGGIAEGKSETGQMNIQWRHRFRPWHPSFSSLTPYWPIGEVVEVGFYVADRCNDNERAPGARYDTFGFRPSHNLEVVGDPTLQANNHGHGYVQVRCLSPGKVSLIAFDKANPADEQMDLLVEDISSGTPPECR